MFEVFEVAVELVAALRAPIASIAARDSDLARQLRRAVASVPLNISEGTSGAVAIAFTTSASPQGAQPRRSQGCVSPWRLATRKPTASPSRSPSAIA